MEIYAAFLEHTDFHIGRLLDSLADLGVLDDTLVYYIIGDNGASLTGFDQRNRPRRLTIHRGESPNLRLEKAHWTLIFNRRHLRHVLEVYTDHYNTARPHRGLGLDPPVQLAASVDPDAPIERIDLLGGLIHQYSRAACPGLPKIMSTRLAEHAF